MPEVLNAIDARATRPVKRAILAFQGIFTCDFCCAFTFSILFNISAPLTTIGAAYLGPAVVTLRYTYQSNVWMIYLMRLLSLLGIEWYVGPDSNPPPQLHVQPDELSCRPYQTNELCSLGDVTCPSQTDHLITTFPLTQLASLQVEIASLTLLWKIEI